jgi:hypothetical protein
MRRPQPLDVVALLHPLSSEALQLIDERYDLSTGLAVGSAGTVVEVLPRRADSESYLVEFSDPQGRGYAFATLPVEALLVIHYTPSEPIAAQQ